MFHLWNMKKLAFQNFWVNLEPPARIELATSSLPMRCYTTKPRWRKGGDLPSWYNRFGNRKNPIGAIKRKRLVRKSKPRSHSLVVRATGNRVGPFPREFKSLSRRQQNSASMKWCSDLMSTSCGRQYYSRSPVPESWTLSADITEQRKTNDCLVHWHCMFPSNWNIILDFLDHSWHRSNKWSLQHAPWWSHFEWGSITW